MKYQDLTDEQFLIVLTTEVIRRVERKGFTPILPSSELAEYQASLDSLGKDTSASLGLSRRIMDSTSAMFKQQLLPLCYVP